MDSSTSQRAVEEALNEIAVNNYFIVAALALYVYDRALSARQEAVHIWGRQLSTASVLYMLLHGIYVLSFMFEFTQEFVEVDCQIAIPKSIVYDVLSVLYDLLMAVIFSLQVYAINGGNLLAPCAVLVLWLISVGAGIFGATTLKAAAVSPSVGCVLAVTSRSTYDIALIVAEAAQTAASLIVLLVTWRTMYKTYKLTRDAKISVSLSVVLLRDGSLYFGLLLTFNVLNVVFHYVDISQAVSYFVALFTNMTLSHFFLNLRAASVSPRESSSNASTQSRLSFQFPQSIGSFRGSLADAEQFNMIGGDEDTDEDDTVEGSIEENSNSNTGIRPTEIADGMGAHV